MISQRRQLTITPAELDAISARLGISASSRSAVFGARTHVCPKCDRVLAIAEVIERYCAHCGDIQPEEVRL